MATVPCGTGRLRITRSPCHTDEDVEPLSALSAIWAETGLARIV
jgi:7-keto-8-aminopelargonate synthetase-like enzyme